MALIPRAAVVLAGMWLGIQGLAVPVSADDRAPERPTVAVLDFDYGAVKVQWATAQTRRSKGQPVPNIDALDVGRGIASLLIARLIEGGGIRLVERHRVSDVAREREGQEGLKARYLVIGTVTRFGGEQATRGGAGMALGLFSAVTRRPLLGMFRTRNTKAYVDLSCRVVDTTTGEILGAVSGSGQSNRRGLLLGGLGGGASTVGGASVSVDAAEFQETILGEATVAAVVDTAGRLGTMLARLDR